MRKIFLSSISQPLLSPVDLDFASVTLLLDFAGADGAQDITDLSNSGHVDTWRNDAEVDTDLQYLGVNSLLGPGNSHAVNFPFSADVATFGTADFTIEFGMRWAEPIGAWAGPIAGGWSSLGGGWYILYNNGATTLRLTNHDTVLIEKTWAPVHSTWYHVAVCRSGTDLRIFIDGTQIGTTETDSTDIVGDATKLIRLLEIEENTNAFTGNLGAVRITKGVARYTENFTAPTVFYPKR